MSLALSETPDRFCHDEAQLKNDISILILGRVLHHLSKHSFISKDCASMCLTCRRLICLEPLNYKCIEGTQCGTHSLSPFQLYQTVRLLQYNQLFFSSPESKPHW